MKNPTFKIAAAAMMVAGAFATQTYAAGFQLSEQSAIQMGRAMAGAGVVGDDLSAVHYNPAGMTLLSGTRMQATGTWVAVNLDYESHDGSVTENGRLKGQTIPAGFLTHQINDSLWAGLGLTVPYGMGTEFDENWDGKDRGTESMILTFDINPNLAWKVNEKLSVGGGVSLQYAKAELGSGRIVSENGHTINSNVKGDSWAWGWNVGVMFQPVETVRLGLAYRSHIAHNADGHTTLSNVPNALLNPDAHGVSNLRSDMEVRIKTPDTVTLSATWEATDALRLSGTARWSKWSNFRSLNVQNLDLAGTKLGTTVVENNWDDTWFFSVGADYKLNGQWTVRGGVAYDQGPVENQYRMAVIPDTDRVWFSGGASYKYTDNLTFDFGATYIKGVGDKELVSANEKASGEFKSLDSYIFSAQMQYLF